MVMYKAKEKISEKPKLSLCINRSDTECVPKHKILGVVKDRNLTWNENINEITKKLSC